MPFFKRKILHHSKSNARQYCNILCIKVFSARQIAPGSSVGVLVKFPQFCSEFGTACKFICSSDVLGHIVHGVCKRRKQWNLIVDIHRKLPFAYDFVQTNYVQLVVLYLLLLLPNKHVGISLCFFFSPKDPVFFIYSRFNPLFSS